MKKHITYDVNYFEKIDTEEKAYFLGWICADGYIKKSQYNGRVYHTLEVYVTNEDSEIIFRFGNAIGKQPVIKKQYNKIQKKTYTGYRLELKAKKTYDDILKLFTDEMKPYRQFPNLHKNLKHHFVRGYFDGDGSISIRKKDKVFEMSIDGNPQILKGLSLCYGILFKIQKDKTTFRIRTNKKANVSKMINYMYQDFSICLNRKYKKAMKFCLK